jgi:hypothetical protein
VSRNAPVVDDEDAGPANRSRRFESRLERRARKRRRDILTVGVLTPTIVVGIAVGLLVLAQTFTPDTYVAPTVVPTATLPPFVDKPTPVPVARAIDTVRLNAGLADKPPPFEWPEVAGLKVQPDPGRASEHADYVPDLSNVDLRRLVAAVSANVILHNSSAFANGAAEELTKPYPLRLRKDKVLDLEATTGYVPDESVFAVVFVYNSYRIQIEAVPTTPPIKATQRSEFEYQALHIADHLARRLQETTTGGKRTGPEDTAVHWRDHIARSLPFGR